MRPSSATLSSEHSRSTRYHQGTSFIPSALHARDSVVPFTSHSRVTPDNGNVENACDCTRTGVHAWRRGYGQKTCWAAGRRGDARGNACGAGSVADRCPAGELLCRTAGADPERRGATEGAGRTSGLTTGRGQGGAGTVL